MSIDNDEQPLDAAGMLDVAHAARVSAERNLMPDPRVLYLTWGIAWLIAYVSRWATTGDTPRWNADVAGAIISNGALAIAVIITVVHVSRRTRGIGGASARVGTRSGLAWIAAFAAYSFVLEGVDRVGAPTGVVQFLAPVLTTLIVGVMYMASGALWDDTIGFAVGLSLLIVASAAAMVTAGEHRLVIAIGGGAGFLLAALSSHHQRTTTG